MWKFYVRSTVIFTTKQMERLGQHGLTFQGKDFESGYWYLYPREGQYVEFAELGSLDEFVLDCTPYDVRYKNDQMLVIVEGC